MAKKETPKQPKRVWAWGQKGTNNLVHTITINENTARTWRDQGYAVVELVENDGC